MSTTTTIVDRPAPRAPAAADPGPAGREAPRRVGPYTLLERLGVGGQAVVWKARRDGPTRRVVALKLFAPGWTLDQLKPVVRLRHRATAGGPLAATAILPLVDWGTADDGRVYFASPLLKGPPLDVLLDLRRAALAGGVPRGVHPLETLPEAAYRWAVAALLARVARAVAAVHAAGLAHGDVKPANLLLGGRGGIYLGDFGSTRRLGGAPLGPASGTPLYMAPEALAEGGDRDAASGDVYALGVTLYEALTLTRPVSIPADLPAAEWPAYLSAAPLPTPLELGTELPAALERIVVRATARAASGRYPTAGALAGALEAFVSGAPGVRGVGDASRPG